MIMSPASCRSPEVCRLDAAARDDGGRCLFTVCEVINGSTGMRENRQGQCSSEHRGVSRKKKKNKNSRRPRRVAAFSLFTGFNIHTCMDSWKLLHRLANHSPAARVCACRWACAWMLGTGYSSPSGPGNNKHDGSARRRWDGRGQMVTKSQCGQNVIMKRRLTKRRLKILTNTAVLKAGSTFVTKRHCLCLSLETDAEGCGWKTHNSDAKRRD